MSGVRGSDVCPGLCQVEGLEVVGDEDVALEVLGGLGGIGDRAGGQARVLGVVEDQVLDTQLLGEHAGVEGCAVVFLVGVEHHSVLVQAEGFAHQPVAASRVGLALHAVGLVAEADEALPVGQLGLEAELLEVGRRDVKECHFHIIDSDVLTVLHLAQDDLGAERVEYLARDHQPCHREQCLAHLVVAVDGERPLVFALKNQWGDLAQHPDGAHDVVGVAMGDEHVADALEGDPRLDDLPQDAVAAAAVHEHAAPWRVQVETGVVAVHAHGIARPQHGDA